MSQNALRFRTNNDSTALTPIYDLNADELRMLFKIRKDNRPLDFGVTLRPYTTERIIRMLREREFFFKPAKDEQGATDLERGSMEIENDFFDEHMLSVTYKGEKLTADQIEKLAWANFKANVVNRGFNGISVEIDESDQAALSLDEILDGQPIVRQFVYLADDQWKESRVDVSHTLRQPTALDLSSFQRAQKFRTLEGNIQKVVSNFAAIAKLYDSMIVSVDGFILSGEGASEECGQINKLKWVEKIPFLFKLNAVQNLFKETQRKNA